MNAIKCGIDLASSPPQIIIGITAIANPIGPKVITTRDILVERQNWFEALERVIDPCYPTDSSGPIHLLKVGRWYYMSDGHHRLARAIVGLHETLKAEIVRQAPTYEDLSDLVKGCLADWVWITIRSKNNLTINILQGDENGNDTNES